MRITQSQELIVAAALIGYIAFMPGFQVVRDLLSTSVGKAIGLSVIVYVWKYVSEIVALLLVINFVRCSGMSMREGLGMCPPGTQPKSDMPGKCSKSVNGVEQLVDEVPATAPPPPPPSVQTVEPITTPSPPPAPPPTVLSEPVTENFSPNEKPATAGGCSFSPF